ncbi:hypothetical protein EPICR_160031 [Candidatus Desulfarcum epimagneticum]|uniref:NACHT domain-containing protein n=1 Tax=uncultured Desulfobacteraceae bacterium TaxID=218296 RepID=A0A484HFU3_9BACT|nr:hypothetical protein EPICR_160031 [uncultured Desulfobacteraceae bacterium]
MNALTQAAPYVLEFLKSVAAGAGATSLLDLINGIKNKTTDKDLEILRNFLSDIEVVLTKTLEKTSIELEIPNKKSWREEWLKSIFCGRSSDMEEQICYLPNFSPVAELRKTIENDMLRLNYGDGKRLEFIKEFNARLVSINTDKIDKVSIERCDYSKDSNLQAIADFKHKKSDGLVKSLNDIYIEPYAEKVDSSYWTPHQKDSGNRINEASSLLKRFLSKITKNFSDRILFIGADFGVGKTTFLRMEASKMAESFIKRLDGFYPTFFDLNNFKSNTHANMDLKLKELNLLNKNCPKTCLFLDSLDSMISGDSDTFENFMYSIKNIIINGLPFGSKAVIASRFIFGPFGHVAEYIRNSGDPDADAPTDEFLKLSVFSQCH